MQCDKLSLYYDASIVKGDEPENGTDERHEHQHGDHEIVPKNELQQ